MKISEQLAAAAGEVARLARGVDSSQLTEATPCPDYEADELMAHLLQEIVLHGWDLAVATGQVPRFPDEAAATVLRWLDHGEQAADDSRWYQPPVETAGTSPLDRAVARSGRDPDWPPRKPLP